MSLVLKRDSRDLDIIIARLCFPHSKEQRKEYLVSRESRTEAARTAVFIKQNINHIRQLPQVSRREGVEFANTLQNLTDELIGYLDEFMPVVSKALTVRPAREVQIGTGQNLKEAYFSGELFCSIYGMWFEGVPEPSKKKALRVVSGERNISVSQLRNYWRKYKNIIHLCAAYHVYAKQMTEVSANPLDYYGPNRVLLSIVTLARAFWEWGIQLIDRNGHPLLSGAVWEPPSSYSLPILAKEGDSGEPEVIEADVRLDEPYVQFDYLFVERLKKYKKI